MRKRTKITLLLISSLITTASSANESLLPIKMLNIGLGYKAKIACSAIFVSGRTIDSVEKEEFTANPVFKVLATNVNYQDKRVETNFLGILKREAVYRAESGCTLINSGKLSQIVNKDELIETRDSIKSYIIPANNSLEVKTKNALNNAVSRLFSEESEDKKNTRAVLVIKNNQIVAEEYADAYSKDSKLPGWSMTKSAFNALTGIRVKDGKLDIYKSPELLGWRSGLKEKITTDHLLRMSSGLQFNEEYGDISDATQMLFLEDDMASFAKDMSAITEADKIWSYSSGTTNIISGIIRRTFPDDRDYYLFPYKRLFSPLGMKDTIIETDAKGNFAGSSYMFATARDWAKLGLLYLNDGKWQGERILPESWVKYTVTPTNGAEKGKYGAHFWLNAGNSDGRKWPQLPSDLFYMSGFEGQYVFIIPSENMVVVRLGQTKNKDVLKIEDFIESLINILD